MTARQMNGNILRAPAQILVCPTNTVGVMGAGLAKAFAAAHPGLLEPYRAACRTGAHSPARPFAWEHKAGIVLCVATKRRWRDPSAIGDVADAIQGMFAWVAETKAQSIAIPALGCGLGGLSWERQVRPLIADALIGCSAEVLIYAPWSASPT